MPETIDLISHSAARELAAFTKRTHQPTALDLVDLEPMHHVNEIELDEEHITITYNETITHRYNAKEVSHRTWTYKYNTDPEFVAAVKTVIDLARRHLRALPENVACPPGCAECCSGYEPFVSRADVQRIADHFEIPYEDALRDYVVQRPSADDYYVGYLRKIDDDVASKCIFLRGRASGSYYCGIYASRPHDCGAFTPIGCEDVDTNIDRSSKFAPGSPFGPRHRPTLPGKRRL